MHKGVKSIRPQAIPALHPAVVRVKEAPCEAACSSSGVSEQQAPWAERPGCGQDALVCALLPAQRWLVDSWLPAASVLLLSWMETCVQRGQQKVRGADQLAELMHRDGFDSLPKCADGSFQQTGAC